MDLPPGFSLDYLPQLPRDRSPRIGCIGAGFIMADCHLVSYREAGFNPIAICSRHPDHAREVAARHEIKGCAARGKDDSEP